MRGVLKRYDEHPPMGLAVPSVHDTAF